MRLSKLGGKEIVNLNDADGGDSIFGTWDDGLILKSESPCLDAADGDAAPGSDIVGYYRIDDEDVVDTGTGNPTYTDMGAYESYAKVYLMAGQSNMQGWSLASQLPVELKQDRMDIPVSIDPDT